MTQKQALLEALRTGPVCSFRFYYDHPGLTHRMAARIFDLRAEGYQITSRACDRHHHEANAVLYELVTDRGAGAGSCRPADVRCDS